MADGFCDRLSKTHGIRARLVTEAEWEYACRAGTVGLYGESDFIDDTKANVGRWQGIDGKETSSKKTDRWVVPGGRYAPNWWGIYDMMGNWDEWCLDSYSERLDISKLPPVDPVARLGGVFKVLRGGSVSWAETVFWRLGDASTATDRGVRIVVEIDDALRAKLNEIGASPPQDRKQ